MTATPQFAVTLMEGKTTRTVRSMLCGQLPCGIKDQQLILISMRMIMRGMAGRKWKMETTIIVRMATEYTRKDH